MAEILFLGGDLNARVRLEAGFDGGVRAVPRDRLADALAEPPQMVVVDLDSEGVEAVEEIRRLGFDGPVLGFFSHVNTELGAAAEAAGAYVFPRGRFWRDLPDLLNNPKS